MPPARRPRAQSEGQVASFEGPLKVRLLDPQDDQGDELQQQARPVEDQVDGDQPLKGKLERQRPGQRRRAAR